MSRSIGAVLLFAVAAGMPVEAQQQARFVVRATVPARVVLTIVEQPQVLSVSSDDVARGYKDVASRYRAESNAPDGWLLSLSKRLGVVQRVEVGGLATRLILEHDSVEIFQSPGVQSRDLELEYRLVLGPGTRPGRYALPVHVSATAL